MRKELCAECISCYEKLLSEPLGEAIIEYIKQIDVPLPFMDNFFKVREYLKHNNYESPEKFVEAFNKSIDDIFAVVGSTSEFSICVDFFRDKVNDSFKQFLDGNRTKFIESTKEFLEHTKEVLEKVPNDKNSFISNFSSNESTGSQITKRESTRHEKKIPIYEQFDLQAMKTQIGLLLEDEDSFEAAQILMTHQAEAQPNENGDIEIDLNICNPYTLNLLKNLLDNAPKAEETVLSTSESHGILSESHSFLSEGHSLLSE